MKTPWAYCKLYFNVFDLDGYIKKEDVIVSKFPKGWDDAELDVVEDGEKVKELLAEFV